MSERSGEERVMSRVPAVVRSLVVVVAFVTLLIGAGSSAASTVDTATVVPVGSTVAGAVQGANRPVFYALDLQIGQRVQVSMQTQSVGELTARLFRPGLTDETLSDTPARSVVPLPAGVTTRAFTADWPGRWIIEVTGSAAAPFTLGVTQLAAGVPGSVSGSTSVTNAATLVQGTRYVSSTYDPDNPTTVDGSRYANVDAEAGDRVVIAVKSLNGRPLVIEAFSPGTTDATILRDEPVGVVRTTTSATLAFDATIEGSWVIRYTTAADSTGGVRPVALSTTLVSVTPRDPATTCDDDVTDVGIVKIRGCITQRRGQVTATRPISFSGATFIPLDGATVKVDTTTLEVRSDGSFAVDLAGMRVLPSTHFFLLKSSKTLEVPEDTAIFGLPVTGSITARWSLENGGTIFVTGNAHLTDLGVQGALSFDVSGDLGLRHMKVRVGVEYLYGAAFTGILTYRRELSGGELINVWRGDLSVAFGVTKPAWLVAREKAAAEKAAADKADGEKGTAETVVADANTSADTTPAPESDATPSAPEDSKGAALKASLVGAGGSLEFREGKLAFLRASVNTKIPIASTGMFVTQLGAALRWNPHFMIAGDGTLTLGPEVNGVSALAIKGHIGWSNGGSCPGSRVSSPNWFGGGEAWIASWFSVLKLDACFQDAAGTSGDAAYVVISGQSGFGVPKILTGDARFDGYILGKQAMMIEASGTLDIWGLGVDGRVVLSDAGLAACGAAYVDVFGMKRRVEIGAERRWANAQGAFGFRCPDFAPYRTVPVARALRTDGVPVTVTAGTTQVDLRIRGANGTVPGIDVIGPDGTVVAQSASTTDSSVTGAAFAPNAADGSMQIALPIITAGTYLIRAQAGYSVASVESSLPRPAVKVATRVTRRNGKAFLTYRIANLDGRRVRFVVTGSGIEHLLGSTRKAQGSLRLPAKATRRGTHLIGAIVLNEQGFAEPQQTVGRYRATNERITDLSRTAASQQR
ncbi:MAG: hypothetical protein ACR2J9_10165 [Gaiellales bacterium]